MEKRSCQWIYLKIANDYNIPVFQVQNILNAYLGLQKERLVNGEAVYFFGLVKIARFRDEVVPHTIGSDAVIIGNQSGLPLFTVATVIKEYLRIVREELKEPLHAYSISGICTIKHIASDTDPACYRTNKTAHAYSDEFRVFTSKFLTRRGIA